MGKWTGRAAAYADSYAHLCTHTAPALLAAAGMAPGVRLLDVGTGTGTVAALAVAGGGRVTAVDAEPGMVDLARGNVPGAEVVEGQLPDLPFPDGAFDAVVANFVVNHVIDPARTVAELLRLTAPGGRVAVTVWPHPAPPLQQLWADVMAAVGLTPAPSSIPPELNFARTTDGVTGLLAGAGVRDVECRTIAWTHQTDVESWWVGPSNGMGALGEALAGQDPATVAAARREYERQAAAYVTADGVLALPTAALLAGGARP
ncbi:class I SAM-dependent methyltransferase [Dactylosporangium cerinum]|uniref:Class I SAM-dependent methyltransferase n=1 Tax=Dactylosporangium cerinum TaxID=1434730 RepID=A0ABV9W7M7_9ACTN